MKKAIWALFMALVLFLPLAAASAYAVEDTATGYGTSGSIGEEERGPENGDHSNWLTVRAGDCGVRVVAQDGKELVAADNYGGIYLNGDVYLNQELLNEKLQEQEPNRVANDFFYLLLVVSLTLNIYCVVKIRKKRVREDFRSDRAREEYLCREEIDTKIVRRLNKFVFLIGVIVFSFVELSLLIHFGDINYRGDTRFTFNRFLLFALCVIVFAVMFVVANYLKKIKIDSRAKRLFIAVASILHFLILIIVGNELVDIPAGNWDVGFCFYNAQNLLSGSTVNYYFVSIPNNIGTFIIDYIIIWIGKLLGYTETIQYSRICVVVNALATEGTILCCVSMVKNVCRNKENFIEFLVTLISYCFIPYYFYSLLFYSDTYSVFFTALVAKLYTDYCTKDVSNKRKAVLMAETAIAAFIGAEIKVTVAIVLVAVLLNELFRRKLKFVLAGCASYLVSALVFSVFLFAVNDVVPTIETDDSYKYPTTLYLQFGAEGDYGDYSADIYTNMIQSIEDIGLDETKSKQIEEILNTLSSRTLIEHFDFYAGKAARLWGDGVYLTDAEVVPRGVDCYLNDALFQDGIIRSGVFYLAQSLQFVMATLVLLGAVYVFRNSVNNRELSAFILALLGVTSFLVFIWELRSRYLYNMTPLIIVCSAIMLNVLVDKVRGFKSL